MSILVDTNLLVRSLQPGHPQFAAAARAFGALDGRGEQLCVVPQVLYEFWSVCTRPLSENGLGLGTLDAQAEQIKALSLFALLPDSPAVLPEWQQLVVRHDVKGKSAHDARLVAAMNVHGVTQILTFNGTDFGRYPGITTLAPETVASQP